MAEVVVKEDPEEKVSSELKVAHPIRDEKCRGCCNNKKGNRKKASRNKSVEVVPVNNLDHPNVEVEERMKGAVADKKRILDTLAHSMLTVLPQDNLSLKVP